ncbi:transposase [Roseateles toxinivorans]|uniref:Transposase n=2 Tax=Roseateles toxinivorans TaxID=270368 RepID=A0A4R6QFZ5_9BURK|nr:transposase [Roseateles toxinivorans]
MEHATRKKVRQHPAQLREQVLSECARPGASVAGVAQQHGLNANLVHAWRRQERDKRTPQDVSGSSAAAPEFIALPLMAAPAAPVQDIRIELRRGATTLNITWPGQAASECAAWLREWLR